VPVRVVTVAAVSVSLQCVVPVPCIAWFCATKLVPHIACDVIAPCGLFMCFLGHIFGYGFPFFVLYTFSRSTSRPAHQLHLRTPPTHGVSHRHPHPG
jgi:hypothetical protein